MESRKAVTSRDTYWQLEGESVLYGTIISGPPGGEAASIVRLTHENSYGPVDDASFFVRVGDPDRPTDQDDLDAAADWVETRLVEELVTVDGEEMLRSEAQEPFEDETPWAGTFEAELVIPKGRRSIEIKLVSRQPELFRSLVLTGWDVM